MKSESFNLKRERNMQGKNFSDVESDHNSEYMDTFCSNGNYQPRDTSIVSI